MKTIKEVVLEQHTIIMHKRDIEMESSESMEFTRENAIDSFGIVELILAIEEALEVELDDCLAEIRKCKTMGEMIEVIEAVVKG